MKGLLKVALFIVLLWVVVSFVNYCAEALFGAKDFLFRHHGAGLVIFYFLFILNVVGFQLVVNKQGFLSLGLRPYAGWHWTLLKGWSAGVTAFLAYTAILYFFGVVEFRSPIRIERVLLAPLVACSAFLIALTEEILFRGFFLQTLIRDHSKWVAVVVTGILFGFFHDLGHLGDFFTEARQAMLFGGIFCLNALLCAAYLKTRMLFLPIGIHSGLVFAKVFFRYGRLAEVSQTSSFLFGLEGDPRRGFLAWVFFLCGILVLKFLITERERRVSVERLNLNAT